MFLACLLLTGWSGGGCHRRAPRPCRSVQPWPTTTSSSIGLHAASEPESWPAVLSCMPCTGLQKYRSLSSLFEQKVDSFWLSARLLLALGIDSSTSVFLKAAEAVGLVVHHFVVYQQKRSLSCLLQLVFAWYLVILSSVLSLRSCSNQKILQSSGARQHNFSHAFCTHYFERMLLCSEHIWMAYKKDVSSDHLQTTSAREQALLWLQILTSLWCVDECGPSDCLLWWNSYCKVQLEKGTGRVFRPDAPTRSGSSNFGARKILCRSQNKCISEAMCQCACACAL